MIDFDGLFEKYVIDYFNAHENELSVEEMEERLPDIYNEWADSPCDKIGGIAPRAFFAAIDCREKLLEIFIGTSSGDNNPSSLLLDRIAQVHECADGLVGVVKGEFSAKQKMIALNLIQEIEACLPMETLAEFISDENCDKDLSELSVEILADNAELVAPLMFEKLIDADLRLKTLIAEILVNAPKDERTYKLLTELFVSGGNIPLYAGYLGKYGDERCSKLLYGALKDCNYLEYIEIKNAIERMGGIVDDDRDFEDDMYFNAIKNIK